MFDSNFMVFSFQIPSKKLHIIHLLPLHFQAFSLRFNVRCSSSCEERIRKMQSKRNWIGMQIDKMTRRHVCYYKRGCKTIPSFMCFRVDAFLCNDFVFCCFHSMFRFVSYASRSVLWATINLLYNGTASQLVKCNEMSYEMRSQ